MPILLVVGISNDQHNARAMAGYERLFKETQGLVDPNKKAHKGSHLNLAIVKSIIDRLYGTIDAKVQDGKVTYQANLKIIWNDSI